MVATMKISGADVLIDEADMPLVSAFKWRVVRGSSRTKYVIAGKSIHMHRLIANPQVGMAVDHINFNGLDNRRDNLRVCTPRENYQHRQKPRRGNNTYKGVHFYKGKWAAWIVVNYKRFRVGTYKSELEAAGAYDAAAKIAFGEFAHFNLGEPDVSVLRPDFRVRLQLWSVSQ